MSEQLYLVAWGGGKCNHILRVFITLAKITHSKASLLHIKIPLSHGVRMSLKGHSDRRYLKLYDKNLNEFIFTFA